MNLGLNWVDINFLLLPLIILILFGTLLMLQQPKPISKTDTAADTNRRRGTGKTINIKEPLAGEEFIYIIQNLVLENYDPDRPGIILCIGSDRCTGDCLGPLVGSLLEKTIAARYKIYGTLKEPVHALNLENCLQEIRFNYSRPFIIAIDASLGHSQQDIGTVIINKGKLHPGSAMHKPLPPVGDLSIVGVVNNIHSLSSTRLYSVTELAHFISTGLQQALDNIEHNPINDIPKIS